MSEKYKCCIHKLFFATEKITTQTRVESRILSNATFCPFFICGKIKIFRCRSPPFINFELKKFEIDRRKKYGNNTKKK